MDGVPAVYLGKIVSKEGFRAFIYSPNGSQKLVGSWEEFELQMESGLWFATIEDAKESIAPKSPEIKVEPEPLDKDKMSSKKKDEDFLPKARK